MIWTTRPRSEFGTLAAIREGNGPPLLLLHGVGLRAEAWAAQIDAFSNAWKVIAPDMPGHGESPMTGEDAGLQDFTDRVASAIQEPVCVAGHSMGAMIASDLAIRYPKKVCALASLNAIYKRTSQAAQAVQERASALDGEKSQDPTATVTRWFGETTSPLAQACAQWLRTVPPQGYLRAYRIFAKENGPSDQGLLSLACPALFATGAADPNSTPAMSEAMAALAPEGRAAVLAGAAHMMTMTHPEIVNQHLAAHFQGCRM